MDVLNINEWIETLPEELLERLEGINNKTLKMLVGLNPSQLKAVLTVDGPVQINAVAGSGKTRVLTTRTAYMINQLKIKPSSIMLTTFTKKATEEMKERLSALIPKMAMAQVTVGTTHSIGYRILKKEYVTMGHHLAPAFASRKGMLVPNSVDCKKFIEKVKKAIMFDRTVQFSVKQELRDMPTPKLLKVISGAKSEGIDCNQFEQENYNGGAKSEVYVEFYKRYEQMKWTDQLIDMDDLLFLLVDLFETYPDILAKYQGLYQYIMVDESQDNNAQQYKLMRMLAKPNYNIFYVGDDDQSMYGFRGAKPLEFIYLKNSYKGLQSINLEDNYRSNPGILDVANKLIAHNTERLQKSLKAHKKDDGQAVAYSKYDNEQAEAKGTVEEIKNLHENEGIEYKKMAILYRTNAQARAVEEELIIEGLPYFIWGGVSFYQRKEVKDIISYLKLVANEHDNEAFKRVINVPSRYLGKAFLEKVNSYNGSNYEAITGNGIVFKNYEKEGISQFVELISNLKGIHAEGATPIDLLQYLMDNCYEAYLKEEGEDEDDGTGRLENIATLKFALERYEKLEDFLEYIDRMVSNAKDGVPTGVQLMTIHKSKGLEFPVCFCLGFSSGILPHFRAIEAFTDGNDLAIEEERRLAYVAITRAESHGYVSSISSFNGKRVPTSQFVSNMGLVPKEALMDEAETLMEAWMEAEEEADRKEFEIEYAEMQRKELEAHGLSLGMFMNEDYEREQMEADFRRKNRGFI